MISLPRRLLLVALIGVLLACTGALLGSGESTRRAATERLAAHSLDELAWLAGLVDESGTLQREQPMPVTVVSDGGPMWALDSVARAVAGSRAFAVGDGPHVLRTEIIDEPNGIALQLHLWRNGWELREPAPGRVRIAPAAAVVGALLGAVLVVIVGHLSWGLALAGVLAQILLAVDPLPKQLFPPQSLREAWASGPLFAWVLDDIRELSAVGMAVVTAVCVGSLVLVAFDHKRTRGGADDVGLGPAALAAVLGSLGLLAWLEAASRGSLLAACDLRFGAWAGLLALVGLILAWLPAIRVSREAVRARAN